MRSPPPSRRTPPRRRTKAGYWCLYRDSGYKGRLLRLFSDGKKDLSEWGCRDKPGSVHHWVGRYSIKC
ncbi:hypothetical protein [Streptomyces sp. DG1A-41]|uniref:hypothetical protein n=1 Tax=Streptomyces sp. DG1A-41 TaxID=3125779 RepID=UPI0030D268FA